MNGISLFSGAGIGELAFKNIIRDYRTIAYVEWEEADQETIRKRIRDGVLDDAPIFGDIREFNTRYANLFVGKVDFISAGFPCQPFSMAGKRKGEADERNMWPATIECLRLLRPQFALLENVPGLFVHEYIRELFADLAESGYDCQWRPLSAAEVGANHRREREWILAYPGYNAGGRILKGVAGLRSGEQNEKAIGEPSQPEIAGSGSRTKTVADTDQKRKPQPQGFEREKRGRISDSDQEISNSQGFGLQGLRSGGKQEPQTHDGAGLSLCGSESNKGNWSVEPNVGRVAHGVAGRVDRLKMLGNGWVPQVVKRILQIAPEKEKDNGEVQKKTSSS